MRMTTDKVYILIVNFNGWHHTIECLESLLKLHYANFQIVVIDNNSSDNSVEHVRSWAEGRLNVWVSGDKPLRKLALPSNDHGVSYLFYRRLEAERGGHAEAERKTEQAETSISATGCRYPLVIIQTECNLGFAGGNNVGIRYALNKGDAGYIWLLNNDTVVHEDALTHLLETYRITKNVGAVGSVHLDYLRPSIVQTVGGGTYRKLLGITKNICEDRIYSKRFTDRLSNTARIDFISGCSILVSTEVVARVGLLDDEYFVYWEDADWSERIKRQGYSLTYSAESVIYHKKGQSSSFYISSYYSTLNCFRFYRKHYTVFLSPVFINRLFFVALVGLKNSSISYVKGSLRAYGEFLVKLFLGRGSL